MSKLSTASGILHRYCPRCRTGNIFRGSIFRFFGWANMYEYCPFCNLKFEREPGYFLGAMYISYALGVVGIALITAALWAATHWGLTTLILWASILYLPLVWPITLFARVLWLYLDWAVDPVPSAG
jgi:uncharacterized protein (DUF983 family)